MSALSLRIRELIAESVTDCPVAPEEMTPDTSLHVDLGCDSLDLLEVVMILEETFSLYIDDEMVASFKTVGDIVAHVEKRVRA